MFTGLIETVGTVRAASGDSPRRLTIASSIPSADVEIGDSIAIDGCCLTVVAKDGDAPTFEAATETLERTTMGALRPGDPVNLERSLRADGRLDGHLVMGHVDGIGTVEVLERRGSALYVGVRGPGEVTRLTASRGSIAMAGVSLTVVDVTGELIFVGLIPHTLSATNLAHLSKGTRVNLEADVLARYVERLLGSRASPDHGSLTEEFLKDKGFV